MKYLVLASLLMVGCANDEPVNVHGSVKIENIERRTALVDIGDFEVLYAYGVDGKQVKYLEPVSVMQGRYVVKNWYIDQEYINESVELINRELGK